MTLSANKVDFSQLVDEHTEKLLSWARFKVSDPESAKDIVQETFMAAYQSFNSFKGGSTHRTWLFSILNRKIIDYYRTKVKKHSNLKKELQSTNPFSDDNGSWLTSSLPEHWDNNEEQLLDNVSFNQSFYYHFCGKMKQLK